MESQMNIHISTHISQIDETIRRYLTVLFIRIWAIILRILYKIRDKIQDQSQTQHYLTAFVLKVVDSHQSRSRGGPGRKWRTRFVLLLSSEGANVEYFVGTMTIINF